MSKEEIELLNSIYYHLGDETELSKEESNLLLKFIKTNNKEIKKLNDIIEKTNQWLEEMLKQEKTEETKAIINGALELLLKDN